ncbi:MAG: ATP-binding protein [Verrucomicrobiota bacterium]
MKSRAGTKYSTADSSRASRGPRKPELRLAGLILTALIGSCLIFWISRTTWERVDRLQKNFASLKPESFYVGVRMSAGILRLNETLLRYRLRGDQADYDAFLMDAQNLLFWFEDSRTNAITPLERDFFNQVGKAYNEYLAESRKLLDTSKTWYQSKAGTFPASYEKVQSQSKQLLALCDNFIRAQRSAFESFLDESQTTLQVFQMLLQVFLALVLGLGSILLVLVYRGMIAPLRHRLTESQDIIDRQEKLASLGVLAAGVAHEIRNPLTAIRLRLFTLKQSLPDGAENEDAQVIANEINRLERIVKDFLQFARPSEPELVVIPAQRLLQEVSDLLRSPLQKNGIQLSLPPAATVWVRVDPQQIKQVLINLVQNSADSIGRDGNIQLAVHAAENATRKKESARVVIEVTDSGKGIPPEVQKRLFDPFFTTKEGGTGLGLPIAARIVEKHRGELHYHTSPGRGTTFAILLPQALEHET